MSDDLSLNDAVAAAKQAISNGWTVYQQYTCSMCGSRQTMQSPNSFYERGNCEKCGFVTNIKARGCNYFAGQVAQEAA